MQQTILAIGALLIIMTTAILHQRSSMITQELAYVRHIEIAAEDIARKHIEGLSTLAFDESTVGASTIPLNTNSLTPSASFGLDGLESLATVDDVDDYHGFIDTTYHTVSTDSFSFRLHYSVYYLDAAGDSSSVPSFTKELKINVRALARIGLQEINGTFTKTVIVTDNLF